MTLLLATCAVLICEAVLGGYVAARARGYWPARLFTLLTLVLLILQTSWLVRSQATHLTTAYTGGVVTALGLSALSVAALLLLSALFLPHWWARLFEPTRAALDLALRAMSEVVAVLDSDKRVVYANPPAERLGLSVGRSIAHALEAAGADSIAVEELLSRQQLTAPDQILSQRLTLGAPARLLEVTLTPVVDVEGRNCGTLLLGRDVTELQQRNELLNYERTRLAEAVRQLSHMASHDSLTGLPNRRSLGEQLYRSIARSRRGQDGALLFIDLDNFKLVNDTLGHAAGDQVLIVMTRLLADQLRTNDLLARLGGDEFAVILDGASLDDARLVAERMRAAVESYRFTMAGRSFELGLSMGLVLIDGEHEAQELLAQADIAMYGAKERGRNQVVVYQPTDDTFTRLSEASEWATRIKDALREDRFVLHFQPVVRLSDGRVEYYEALIRLQDRHGTLIPPGAFIPAAERFGLMPQCDRWLIHRAIQTLGAHPGIHLFVNLSGRSLADEALVEFVEAELDAAGVAPERLGFEVNEAAAIQEPAQAERWIRRITSLGCRFAMDDFGMGFSSFTHLRSLPIDRIKIDGALIRNLDQDPANREIVRAMHNLGQALGKTIVAEFVERAAVAESLREIGITFGQGYHLGLPSPDLPGGPDAETPDRPLALSTRPG